MQRKHMHSDIDKTVKFAKSYYLRLCWFQATLTAKNIYYFVKTFKNQAKQIYIQTNIHACTRWSIIV